MWSSNFLRDGKDRPQLGMRHLYVSDRLASVVAAAAAPAAAPGPALAMPLELVIFGVIRGVAAGRHSAARRHGCSFGGGTPPLQLRRDATATFGGETPPLLRSDFDSQIFTGDRRVAVLRWRIPGHLPRDRQMV